MKKYAYKTDLATELLKNAVKDHDYKVERYSENHLNIEHFEILNKSHLYPHEVGHYIEMSFDHLNDQNSIIKQIQKQLKILMKSLSLNLDPIILIVGLGNISLTCDALGPMCSSHIQPTFHLPIIQRHQKHQHNYIVLTPGVMGQTGIETSTLIKNIIKEYHVDLVIAIDALCASDYQKLCRVIQMNNVGIYPGSGIGNHREGLTLKTLHVPVISIGVPTVIHVSSLINHIYSLLEGYFKESMLPSTKLKVSKRKNYQGELNDHQKRLLLGEIGLLENRERSQLFKDILDPLENHYILTPKQIDEDIKQLAYMISSSINELTL